MTDDHPAVLRQVRLAQRDGNTAELVRAVRRLADVTDLDSDPTEWVAALADAYYQLSERNGEVAPLLAARHAYEVALARDAGQQPATWRSYLGLCLVRESERTGRHEALDEALPLLRSAAADLPADVAAHANFGLGLQRQMVRAADVALLPEALAAAEVAAAAATRRPGTRARILSNTSSTLMVAWELTGKRAHLDAAILAADEACVLVPAGDLGVPGCAATLARALLARSEVTGDRAAPVTAARQLTLVLRAVPADDPDRPIYLNQRAIAHRMTFAASSDLAALDEAIRDWGEAVRRLPEHHPDRAAYRMNRAGALRNRFETIEDIGALDEAVRDLEDVLAGTAAGDPERPARLAGLANALHRKGADFKDPDLLRRAADLLRSAAAETSSDRPEHREHQANLGSVLLTGARLGPTGTPLDEVIDILARATAGTGPEEPELSGALLNLGDARTLRWERTGDGSDLEAAAETYGRLIDTPAAAALSRATAAHSLGRLRVRARDWPAARDSLGRAVELLDLVAWAGLGRDDQERLLLQFPALARTAAACALELGDPDGAVEILEQGRGVLYAQALNRWAGTDEVRGSAPQLAERLGAVHDLLEASHRAERATPWDRHRAVREREAVLEKIRGTPGLQSFLRPPRISDLRARLDGRTVVIVNVAAHRCDALLLTGTATHQVPLPGLRIEDINRHAGAAIRPGDDALRDTLAWLWDTLAGPVLDRLDRVAPTGHVWWMPTGALSFLPIHAAGHHGPGDGTARSALHRVVSSYAPTLSSLVTTGPPPVPGLAAVVAPAVRSQPGLPAALREAGNVQGRLGAAAVLVTGPDATTTRVRDLLADASWAHFAGHARADPGRPSDSHLALYDGPLRVRDILRHQARERTARTLAYLSACSTVQGGTGLPDENIHIASALLLAGFGDVIATSWPVPDTVATRAAELIYEGLRSGRPAAAVNAATRALRDRYPQRPSQWAAHVHVGADQEIMFPTG